MSDRESTPTQDEYRTFSPISTCSANDDSARSSLPMPTMWNLGPIQLEATQRVTMTELMAMAKLNLLESNVAELTNMIKVQTEIVTNVTRACHMDSNIFIRTLMQKLEVMITAHSNKDLPRKEVVALLKATSDLTAAMSTVGNEEQ